MLNVRSKFILIITALAVMLGTFLFPSFLRYLNKERAYIKEKSKAVALGYYLPPFERLAQTLMGEEKTEKLPAGKFLEYYEKAAVIFPHLKEDIHALLGYFHHINGENEVARSRYLSAIDHNSHFFWNYYNLGLLYFQEKEYEKSKAVLNEALQKEAGVTFLAVNKIALYRQIWRYMPNIEQYLKQSFERGREDVVALIALDDYHLGNYPDVVQIAAMATRTGFADQDFYLYYAGLSLMQMGQPEQAISFWQQALAINPENAPVYYQLGVVLKQLGKEDMAESFLIKAASLQKIQGDKTEKIGRILPKIF